MKSPPQHPERSRIQQWLRIAGIAFAAMTLLFVIMMGALWHYRTPLLNDVAKPHLEQFLSTGLEAQVTIEHVALDKKQLILRGMTFDRADFYRVTVSSLILEFNLFKLLRGQLNSLQLERPELTLKQIFVSEDRRDDPIRLPKPPISIDLLKVSNGHFDLVLVDQVVEVRAVEFDMQHAPSGNFHLEFTVQGEVPLKLSADGVLQWEATPELQLNELNIDARSLLTTPLTIRPAANELVSGGELVLAHFDRAQLDPWLVLLGAQQSLPAGFDFSIQNLRLGVETSSGQLHGQLAVDALHLTTEQISSQVNNLRLKVSGDPDQWYATGEAQLAEGSPLSFAVQGTAGDLVAFAQGTFLDLARVPELLGKEHTLPVSGGLEWMVRAGWRDKLLELNGDFHGLQPQPSAGAVSANLSRLRGKFQVNGALDQLSGKGTFNLDKHPLLTLAGDSGQLTAELHRTSLISLAEFVDPSLWPQVVKKRGWLAGQAQLQLAADHLQGRLNFTAEGLEAGSFELGTSRISSAFLWQQEQLALSELRIDASTTGQGVAIPVATLQGAAHWHSPVMQLDIATLKIENLEYLAADDMSALAGGTLDLTGTVEWDEVLQRLRSRLQGTTQVQEALVHSFYGDLSQLPMDFLLQGDWDNTAESLQLDEITLSLPDIVQLKGHGSWHPGDLKLTGELRFPKLEHGFNLHLQPLLTLLFPEVKQLDLSGTLAVLSKGELDADGWNISGTLLPDNLGLKHRTADISMIDLSGEIPFAFFSRKENPNFARSGFLTFKRLQAGPVVAEGNYLALTSSTNRLTFVDPWKLNLAGGRILIENLSFGYASADLLVRGRTLIENIDLQQLTQALELTPMQGSLTADLGEFEYIGSLLQSEGEARIDVFGGTIQIRNLRARDIFSSYRSFEGDIDFLGIDLEQLTKTFEFGEINGIIDGYIHDLRLFGKVPSAFVAEFTTRDQGARNISVKALNNLTLISQGGLSAALSRGVYRFIDFYRYRKIGLFCALRNDVFVLKGTARDDSDLHIVDGGLLPPRIDVLAPGTAVSFREMLRRLDRIDRTTTR